MKPEPAVAAANVVNRLFPGCRIAILGGSAGAGRATAESDLDLIVIDDGVEAPYRQTFRSEGWLVEAFVLTTADYRSYSVYTLQEAIPSIQRMIAEGIVIRDDGTAVDLREEAAADLAFGPFPWKPEEREYARYRITEYADDLRASLLRDESLFTVQELLKRLEEFILRSNGLWLGEGKWRARAIAQFDPELYRNLVEAAEAFYRMDDKEPLLQLTERQLAACGGLLREGFTEYVSFPGQVEE